MPDWRTPAKQLTDVELLEAFVETGKAFDASQEGDGHGGSPGEWAWERCGELEHEIKRRNLSVPVSLE